MQPSVDIELGTGGDPRREIEEGVLERRKLEAADRSVLPFRRRVSALARLRDGGCDGPSRAISGTISGHGVVVDTLGIARSRQSTSSLGSHSQSLRRNGHSQLRRGCQYSRLSERVEGQRGYASRQEGVSVGDYRLQNLDGGDACRLLGVSAQFGCSSITIGEFRISILSVSRFPLLLPPSFVLILAA